MEVVELSKENLNDINKSNFVIGGVNNMLYKKLGKPSSGSSAVFWYLNL